MDGQIASRRSALERWPSFACVRGELARAPPSVRRARGGFGGTLYPYRRLSNQRATRTDESDSAANRVSPQ